MAVKRRLTAFSRLIITLALTAGIFFGVKWLLENTELKEMIENAAKQNQMPEEQTSNDAPAEQ